MYKKESERTLAQITEKEIKNRNSCWWAQSGTKYRENRRAG